MWALFHRLPGKQQLSEESFSFFGLRKSRSGDDMLNDFSQKDVYESEFQ